MLAVAAPVSALGARPSSDTATRRLRVTRCWASVETRSAADGWRRAGLGLAAGLAAAAIALAPLPAAAQAEATQEAATYTFQGKDLFEPKAYAGRWYEVASLKKGFAGEGQQDCHCTQGIYVLEEDPEERIRLQVNTFCVHGGPGGRLSGIQGTVSCANPVVLELLPEFKSEMDVMEGVVSKCALRFDSLPFIPPEPYVVLRTDYTSYALVRGAKDRSFVQVYSRTPNPGPGFIAKQKAVLSDLGYPANEILDTPQDCGEMSESVMMTAMNRGMAAGPLMPANTPPATAMRGYDLGPAPILTLGPSNPKTSASPAAPGAPGPVSGIQFEALRNPLQSLKNALSLFGGN